MKRSFIVVLVVLATALGGGSVWYFGKRARPAAASLPASAAIPVVAATVTGKPGIDAGALRLAAQLEPLTAVLISINKNYQVRSGVAVAGLHGTKPEGL